ncbi:MAG: dicarboxylate/amino acid:cation symporter [Nitrospirota bacterium]|jgi:solute carrier family 1 (high affinity glutamate transporter) protein 1|nr:dicarboxylate/amino acid:cation symporter [Nitrospirota bacterium]MDH4361139.1 dicarboxylate/amino acid:cation symporter [Nitrospirota bacterium]MDH5575388.1 dicarboxylate/amino acid:cation symporter [Nitrospirota bacterium]
MLLGILTGILVGGFVPSFGLGIQFLGDLFLQALFALVVPLVVSSMIVGIASLGDVRQLGPLGIRTVLFFMTTTGLAVLVGLILVIVLHPGVPLEQPSGERSSAPLSQVSERMEDKPTTLIELFKSILTSLVPKNLFAAMAETQILPLIVFALIFGGVLTTIGEKGILVIRLFEGINDAMMAIVHLLMWVAPVGIGALIAGRLGEAGGFAGFLPQLSSLGTYVGTVLLALAIHGLLILPLALRILGKKSVPSYAKAMTTPLMTAFSTSSSSATLPLTMESLIEEAGVSRRVVSFVVPLGATINMNGTALYEAVAAMFIAQSYGIELGLGETIIVLITATLSAIGAAGIPEAGLVTMVIVLKAVDLPIEGISLILVVDWFLDRCRTTVNVWGDAVGAAVIDRWESTVLPLQAQDSRE